MTPTPAPTDDQIDMYLVCCTQVILNEIEQGLDQKQIALSYAMAIRSAVHKADSPDWKIINKAIIERWSMSGLERIKTRAISIVKGEISP